MEITVFMAFGEQIVALDVVVNALLILGALKVWLVIRRPPRD